MHFLKINYSKQVLVKCHFTLFFIIHGVSTSNKLPLFTLTLFLVFGMSINSQIKNSFSSSTSSSLPGGADAVQGCSYQADERDPERHQSPKAVCLGELLQRKGPGHPAEGAQCAAQDSLPGSTVHHGLDQCPFPGRLSPHVWKLVFSQETLLCDTDWSGIKHMVNVMISCGCFV